MRSRGSLSRKPGFRSAVRQRIGSIVSVENRQATRFASALERGGAKGPLIDEEISDTSRDP
jgi:hypothetical protein